MQGQVDGVGEGIKFYCVRTLSCSISNQQDEIFRSKCLSSSANLVQVYLEIWDKGILKFNKFSM